jgi:hypothetical protein
VRLPCGSSKPRLAWYDTPRYYSTKGARKECLGGLQQRPTRPHGTPCGISAARGRNCVRHPFPSCLGRGRIPALGGWIDTGPESWVPIYGNSVGRETKHRSGAASTEWPISECEINEVAPSTARKLIGQRKVWLVSGCFTSHQPIISFSTLLLASDTDLCTAQTVRSNSRAARDADVTRGRRGNSSAAYPIQRQLTQSKRTVVMQ